MSARDFLPGQGLSWVTSQVGSGADRRLCRHRASRLELYVPRLSNQPYYIALVTSLEMAMSLSERLAPCVPKVHSNLGQDEACFCFEALKEQAKKKAVPEAGGAAEMVHCRLKRFQG